MSKKNIITIDGPAGVGKSTVSRKVAVATGFSYLDTGAMYRAVGWYLQHFGIDTNDQDSIRQAFNSLIIKLMPAQDEYSDVGVLVNGEDVSKILRTPEMAMIASRISAIPVVREFLTVLQKQQGEKGKIVAEGRDTGTVVFPEAAYKFFLDAKPEIRAKRRVGQLRKNGVEADFQEILALTMERDQNDRTRLLAPLRKAEDAELIDTSASTVEEVVSRILMVVNRSLV